MKKPRKSVIRPVTITVTMTHFQRTSGLRCPDSSERIRAERYTVT